MSIIRSTASLACSSRVGYWAIISRALISSGDRPKRSIPRAVLSAMIPSKALACLPASTSMFAVCCACWCNIEAALRASEVRCPPFKPSRRLASTNEATPRTSIPRCDASAKRSARSAAIPAFSRSSRAPSVSSRLRRGIDQFDEVAERLRELGLSGRRFVELPRRDIKTGRPAHRQPTDHEVTSASSASAPPCQPLGTMTGTRRSSGCSVVR